MRPLTYGTLTALAGALLALSPAFSDETADNAERVTWAETSQTLVAEEQGTTSEEQANPAESQDKGVTLDPKEDPAADTEECENDEENKEDCEGAL